VFRKIPEILAIDRRQAVKRRQQQVDVKQIEEAILNARGKREADQIGSAVSLPCGA
jgi:hypothetical protein